MPDDRRPAVVLLKQWREFSYVRQQLVKQGLVAADATPVETLEAIRRLLPMTMFGETGDGPGGSK